MHKFTPQAFVCRVMRKVLGGCYFVCKNTVFIVVRFLIQSCISRQGQYKGHDSRVAARGAAASPEESDSGAVAARFSTRERIF